MTAPTPAAWAFGLRTWLAMVLALYAAFWLQLDGASSAAVCVALLALPTRGNAIQKALYRVLGTVVGVTASIVLAGCFNETRTLFLLALAAWLAACVYVAGLLDGNKAYAAVLSGYTVAIVALPTIDTPQTTFLAGMERGAAIVIGIVALALVNDLFALPDLLPGFLRKLSAARHDVRAFSCAAAEGGTAAPGDVVRLFGELSALRADALALPVESVPGRARAAAARQALTSLVAEAWAAYRLARSADGLPPEDRALRDRLAQVLRRGSHREAHGLAEACLAEVAAGGATSGRVDRLGDMLDLIESAGRVETALSGVADGRFPTRAPGLPTVHLRQAAARNAVRVSFAFVLGSVFFVLSGWPATTLGLLHIALFMSLSVTNPAPETYAYATLLATALVVVVVGVSEFLMLDGVDQFPLLALVMLPTVVGASVLKTSKKPLWSTVGLRALIFYNVLLDPELVQSYSARSYVEDSIILLTAAALFVICRLVILPRDAGLRRRWLIQASRADLPAALADRRIDQHRAAEASFRGADLLGQLSKASFTDPAQRKAVLDQAVADAEAADSVRRGIAALRHLAPAERNAVLGGANAVVPDRLSAAAARLRARARRAPSVQATGELLVAARFERAAHLQGLRP